MASTCAQRVLVANWTLRGTLTSGRTPNAADSGTKAATRARVGAGDIAEEVPELPSITPRGILHTHKPRMSVVGETLWRARLLIEACCCCKLLKCFTVESAFMLCRERRKLHGRTERWEAALHILVAGHVLGGMHRRQCASSAQEVSVRCVASTSGEEPTDGCKALRG